ncbi:MAG TPA: paraquat-inducible protein A [Vicinamibacterales bacterium]|nr:paraquat-inducible protein A [Vicinamibacterales bacterium]
MEKSPRAVTLVLLVVSLGLLIPGIFLPVLTIRGVLTKEGVAYVAPLMLDKGLNEDTMATLKSLINPQMVSMMQALGGDLRQMIIDRLGPQLATALQQDVGDIEVYQQTRSIIGAVRQLYDVGSPLPATLILLFSVVVPLTKAALVAIALYMRDAPARLRTLHFVETIAKWSMADVFAVALFIVFLAAQASQQPPGAPESAPPLLAFTAHFGSGFYWFAAYCLFSLASQQYTARLARQGAMS